MSAGTGSIRDGDLTAGDGLRLHSRERVLSGAPAQILLVQRRGRARRSVPPLRGVLRRPRHRRLGGGPERARAERRPSRLGPDLRDPPRGPRPLLGHVRSHSRPVFLVGHSLGGLIAIRLAETRRTPLPGLVASGAALKAAIGARWPVVWLLRQLNRVSSATPVPGLVDAGRLSRDPDVVRQYESDPLVAGHLTTGLGLAVLETGRQALADADRIETPTLLLTGAPTRWWTRRAARSCSRASVSPTSS